MTCADLHAVWTTTFTPPGVGRLNNEDLNGIVVSVQYPHIGKAFLPQLLGFNKRQKRYYCIYSPTQPQLPHTH